MISIIKKIPKILLILILASAILWKLKPDGISEIGWHLLIIFISTIITIISAPMPLGALAILSLTATVVTGTLSTSEALSGFNSDISWLILLALFVSESISKSGLGMRIAYYLIGKSRNSLISLSYTLVICELILSPAIPSAVARGSGIIYPILTSLIEVLNKKEKKEDINFYLIKVCFNSTVITSAITLTAMAANPLIISIAGTFGINISWNTWFIAAIIPGLLNLILMPIILYYILKPNDIDISEVKEFAKNQLDSLKAFTKEEILITSTLIGLITLWIFGDYLEINATETILIGCSLLLITGIITWDEVIANKKAWEIFIWFSTLLMLSEYLVKFGAISWINEGIQYLIHGIDKTIMIPVALFLFFYLHYLFVSITAYVSILFAPFLIILLNLGIPEKISVMVLAIIAILSGGLTHYTIGIAPSYYSISGVKVQKWCKIGFFISTINVLIWLTVCAIWWKFINWY